MNERAIFMEALDIDTLAERSAYLDEACGGDTALRRRIEVLLTSHEQAGSFMGKPVPERLAAPEGPTETQGESPAADGGEGLDFLTPSDKPGSLGRLGHYEVQEVIGRGGFGIVLRAFDELLHRVVAIKVMAPHLAATSPARKRFLREARAAAAIRHENVVAIYAVEEQPIPYLVMEFIAGQTLQAKLDQTGPLGTAETLRIGRQIAGGLEAAHAGGLIHRDIKPANILLENGVEPRVKITDFGLARAANDATLTQSGVIAGTPMYMAPEQAQGGAFDHRADLFSLGSVLYTMCSGRPPFRASTTLAVLKRVCEDAPRPIREIIPEVPEWLAAIIARLHAKDPAERFQSAREVTDVLGRELAVMERGGERPTTPPPAPPAKRTRRLLVAAAALVALGVLGTGGYLLAPTVIRIVANQGELVIETDDPNVEVIVKQGGEQVKIIEARTQREVVLKAGSYQLELVPGKDGQSLSLNHFTLERGGKEIVKVRLKPMIAAQPPAADLFHDAVLHMTFAKDTFYEKYGETYVRDLSANGYDGLCEGVAYTPEGKTGGALKCDGKGRLRIPHSLLNQQANYTVTAWVRLQKNAPDGELFEEFSSQNEEMIYVASLVPGQVFFCAVFNKNKPGYWLNRAKAGDFPYEKWVFLTSALENGGVETGSLRVTVDDKEYHFSSQSVDTSTEDTSVALGKHLEGKLGEVAVFHRFLSAGEIEAIRQRGSDKAPPP